METFPVTLLKTYSVGEITFAFDVTKPAGYQFSAGQFTQLGIPELVSSDPRAHWRWMSIVSAPHEEVLTFALRDGLSPFKQLLVPASPGYALTVGDPKGLFTVPDVPPRPIIFLAGGIGITPVISILRDAVHQASTAKLSLIYSNYYPACSPFYDELSAVTLPEYQFIPTMTDAEKTPADWAGERGFIDFAMLKRHCSDPLQQHYYIVGPPTFVAAMVVMLKDNNVPAEQIKLEKFTGM